MFGRKGREKNELVLFILMKPTNRNKSNKKGKKPKQRREIFKAQFFFHHTLSCWKPNFMPWVTVGAPINWGWVLFKGTRSHLIG